MRIKFLFLLCFLFSINANANEAYWDLDTLANQVATSSSIKLFANNRVNQNLSKEYVLKLYEVKNNIANKAGIYPKFLISDSQEINAYATWQNGQPVTIFTLGILNKIGDDYDSLAAVVGHEFSHLTLQHAKSSQTTSVIVELLAGLAMIAIDSSYRGAYNNPYRDLYKTGLNVAANLTLASYSRSEELEADAQGVRYMVAAGYSAEGAVRLQEKIIPASASFFSSHPSSSSRIDNIRLAMNSYSGKEVAPQPYVNDVYAQSTVSNTQSNTYVNDAKYLSFTQPCVDKGLDPNSSLFDACVFKMKKASEKSNIVNNTPSLNLPIKGQIGSVIAIKNNPNYIIFSSSTAVVIPLGTKVTIGDEPQLLKAEISRGYDGYYLVDLSETKKISQGDRVFLDN